MANYNLTQTGAEVQVILDRVSAGYIYMGTADLTTTPDTTNPNVCYLLTAVGTYTNFGNILHTSGIGIALWSGSAWSYQNVPSAAVVATDATPVEGSVNPVQSGGVYPIKEALDGITQSGEMVYPKNWLNWDDSDYKADTILNTSGGTGADTSYGTSGFIPVIQGQTYHYTFGDSPYTDRQIKRICYYDSNKTFISGSAVSNISSGTFTPPSNAAYFRMSAIDSYFKPTPNSSVMLYYGATPTEYSDYFEPYEISGGLKDGIVRINNIYNKEYEYSPNLINTENPNYLHQHGKYIKYDTGETATADRSSYPDERYFWGYTGFIPYTSELISTNCYGGGSGFAGYAIYNSQKQYVRGAVYWDASHPLTFSEGDAYIRFTLSNIPDSPFTADQFMANKGTTLFPYYLEYEERLVISPDILPKYTQSVPENSVGWENLNISVANSIAGYSVEFCLPDTIPCVVGDRLRIYWRSIIKSPNPYIWDITAISGYGKSYPRYYEITPTAAGNISVTFRVRNCISNVIAEKTVTIKAINHATSPSSNKNILMIGASVIADGKITKELTRRFTLSTGDNTPLNPTGLGLSNISFVGRLTGTAETSVHQEAQGGWNWSDFATEGRQSYRFQVSGVNLLHIGDTYKDSANHYVFTIEEINITEGSGNIRCTYTGSGTLAASGTLTRTSGTGDASISYSSQASESANPFWNSTSQSLDFTTYANTYCNGAIDYIVSYVGLNDMTLVTEYTLSARIENYVKPFLRAFHTQFPSGKVLLGTLNLGSVSGGMAANYGASATWNYYTAARKIWKYSELLRGLASDDEFSSYVVIIDTISPFDCETLYPTSQFAVANRNTETETLQTNGLHPTDAGKLTIADNIYEALNDVL